MSDIEDDPFNAPDYSDDPPAPKSRPSNEEEEEEEDDAPPRRGRDSDDDDDEEDEDEDEEEEEEVGGSHRPKKRRRKRNAGVSMFIDEEAEVDDEDDEDEEDGEDGVGDFIAGPEGDDDIRRVSASHIRRDREFEDRPEDLTAIAEDYAKRYRQSAPTRYTGDLNDVPQRLLMPSVQDANLWQVRVKPGKEREIVLSLMRKSIDLEFTPRPLEILAVFQRDSLPGMIYVEARSSKQVSQAMQGLVGVYPSRGVTLVPIEEMAALLQIKKQDVTVQPGTWVRIRRGKYAGDLAQIMDVTENGEEVGLKFIPRIDLNPRDEILGPDGKKRKKVGGVMVGSVRPPQRFFNFEEVAKVYKRQAVSNRGGVFVFQNDTYRDGFVEKDFRISALQLDDVNPTLDEITMFSRGQEGAENDTGAIDLSIIAEASRKAAIAVLQPGDHVEVFEGEQAGVHGIVHSVAQDIVTITASGVELDGQKIDVPARSVRKRFKAGDHVKVMTGKNSDETGLVVAVSDNIVTFLSDMSLQEVSVFSKDLREAAEVGASTNTVGNYELHDLVQLDAQNVGVIFKTERDSFRVLDQNGQVRLVQPHQISMRRDSNRAIAMDSESHELRVGDNVKEVEGEARKGRVLHLYQSFFAFLHNRDIPENGGVFVTRARSLASQIPKGAAIKPGMDTTKMNPSMAGGAQNVMLTMMSARGPRDRLQGLDVKIVKGQFKGHIGIIKDTNGPSARVEVSSKSKIITMDLDKLMARKPDGSLEELRNALDSRGPRGPKPSGGMGPPSNFGKTPNPYAGGTTPGWSASRTPNPYGGGGKTPAWGDSSRTPAWGVGGRTPNPYASGKTPAWDAGAKTPNPYATGSKTPAWDSGAKTPNPYGNSSGAPAGGWNATSPMHPSSGGGGGGWGDSSSSGGGGGWGATSEPSWSAPASAPTPGVAATPAAWAATPGFAAPTPGASGADDSEELDPDSDDFWLVKFNADSKRGLVVEVQGSNSTTDSADGWHSGKYEGQQAIVITAIANLMSSGGNVTLKFDTGEELIAPPKLCKRVPPTSGNDTVMVISGKLSGQVVRLISQPDADAWMCLRTNGAYEEFPTSRLCLFRG